MGKKKKHRSSYPRAGNYSNHHHLFWHRRRWDRGFLKALRSYPYCIVEIPANTLHRNIHENLWQIPTPSQENAEYAIKQLEMLKEYGAINDNDSIEKKLIVLIALFDCGEEETTDALRKQLEIVYKFNKGS